MDMEGRIRNEMGTEMEQIIRMEMGTRSLREHLNNFYCNLPGEAYRIRTEQAKYNPKSHTRRLMNERMPMSEVLGTSYEDQISEEIEDVISHPWEYGLDSCFEVDIEYIQENIIPRCHSELRFRQSELEFYETFDRVVEQTCDTDMLGEKYAMWRQLREQSSELWQEYERRRKKNKEDPRLEALEQRLNSLSPLIELFGNETHKLLFPAYVRLREIGYTWHDLCA